MNKILVVDDDQDIRELIAFTLQLAGYEMLTAANGGDAISICTAQHPDLVLMDVRLPGMSGYEVCRKICSNPATSCIPVAFLSAKGQLDEIRKGLEAGAVDYFLKPFAPEELVNKVKELLLYHS